MGWKALEVLGILLAGGLFAWWQFRDLRQAKAERERAQAEDQAKASPPNVPDTQAESDHER